MGKPTGFLDYPRELPLVSPPVERVHHWDEFHGHADEALLRNQGARCMDCGVPFCPTGLACSAQLNKAGHLVTVFERGDRVGGLLMYGIPNMKLDKKKVVERRVEILEAEGITFKTGCEVGKDVAGQELLDGFDAVVV